MGIRKIPSRTGVVAATKNPPQGLGKGFGGGRRTPGWFQQLVMHSVIVDYDVIVPPPPPPTATEQDN